MDLTCNRSQSHDRVWLRLYLPLSQLFLSCCCSLISILLCYRRCFGTLMSLWQLLLPCDTYYWSVTAADAL